MLRVRLKRRRFLAGAGLVGSMGLLGLGRGVTEDPLSVVVWFSERAAAYEGLRSRVSGYLPQALEAACGEVDLAFGDRPIPLDDEGGARLMEVEWPMLVLRGAIGLSPVDRTGNVNLLVTDGDPGRTPAGYGMWGVATVSGARLLTDMPSADRTPAVVEYSGPAAVTQLLLHECGHALGLGHRHGSVTVDGDALVASPMVGGYAWADEAVRRRQLGRDGSVCGSSYPDAETRRRRLHLRYSPCATRAIRRGRENALI